MTPDLIARYDQRVPRYTSYPTAPHFTSAVGSETFARWLAELPAGAKTSLYLHVPFCAELCLYCGCHTTVTRRYGPVQAYVALMEREMDLVAQTLRAPINVSHVHWGGGTPTLLSVTDFLRLTRRLRARFGVPADAEVAVEIDPRTITPAHIEALALGGVNRASLGVQSFDPLVQQTIRRIQSVAETRRVVEWLRHARVERISLDVMYGLPYQTVENVVATVEASLELDPDRLSLFGYAHVPWMKRHQALLPEDVLPRPSERIAQFDAAAERIVKAGYVRIGLDHFAKPDDPLAVSLEKGTLQRNFQGYTTDAAPALIGFGTSAISKLPQGYAQNASATPDYRAAIMDGRFATARGVELTEEDRLRAEVIRSLMCDLHVDLEAVCRRFGVEPSHFEAELSSMEPLVADGLAERDGLRIVAKEPGRALIRNICAVFDARLPASTGRHAQAV